MLVIFFEGEGNIIKITILKKKYMLYRLSSSVCMIRLDVDLLPCK